MKEPGCVRFCCTTLTGKSGVTLTPTWYDCAIDFREVNPCRAPLISLAHITLKGHCPQCVPRRYTVVSRYGSENPVMHQADRYLLLPNTSRIPLYHFQRNLFLQTLSPLPAMSGSLVPGCQLLEQVARNWMQTDASKLPTHLNPCSLAALLDPTPCVSCFHSDSSHFPIPGRFCCKTESYLFI